MREIPLKKLRDDGWEGVRRRGVSAATLRALSDNRGLPARAEPYLSSGGGGWSRAGWGRRGAVLLVHRLVEAVNADGPGREAGGGGGVAIQPPERCSVAGEVCILRMGGGRSGSRETSL